jgi:hypothetical protein
MGNIKTQLDTLLHQEMDRKNFLRYSGGILLALLGVTGLVRILLSSNTKTIGLIDDQQKRSHGYGSSKYGQ